jgi:hypothetical protein
MTNKIEFDHNTNKLNYFCMLEDILKRYFHLRNANTRNKEILVTH